MTGPSATAGTRAVPGPRAIAGAAFTANVVAGLDIDPAVKDQVVKALGALLPGRPVRSGATLDDRTLPPDALEALVPSAAIVAAGFDPATVAVPIPDALWRNGAQQLVLRVAKVRANLGTGLIEIVVPVSCDQTGDVEVTVSFVTGSPDRPAGGIATTEDHPRGPSVVVENWAEPLIAYAWQTLITATSALSSAGGADLAGRELITATLAVSPDGVTVTPLARHAFTATGVAR